MTRSRFGIAGVWVILFVVVGSAGAVFEEAPVDVQVTVPRGADSEITFVELKRYKTIDRAVLYHLEVRISNLTDEPTAVPDLEYEIWSGKGYAMGGGIIRLEDELGAHEERTFEVNTSLSELEIGAGDHVIVRPAGGMDDR